MIYNYHSNANKIIVHAGILKKRSDYSLFIWGEQKKQKKYVDVDTFKYPFLFSPFELKLALFRYNEPSFYGTTFSTTECFIEVPLQDRMFYSEAGNIPIYHVPPHFETHLFPIEGIEIAINDLPNFCEDILKLEANEEWVLANDFLFLQQSLKQTLLSIKEGYYLPDQTGKWQLTHQMRILDEEAPPSFFSLYPTISAHTEKKGENPSLYEFVNACTNAYLRFIISTDDHVQSVFSNIKKDKPSSVVTFLDQLVTEKDGSPPSTSSHLQLLERIGAVKASPFKMGLKVQERPNDTKNLTLSLFIQDRTDPTLMFDLEELISGNHPWLENPITFLKQTINELAMKVPLFPQFSLTNPSVVMSIEEAFDFLTSNEEIFNEVNISILVPSWWKQKETNFAVTLLQTDNFKNQNTAEPLLNWNTIAQFDYTVSIGDVTLSETEFSALVSKKQSVVNVRGKWVVWDVQTASIIHNKIATMKKSNKATYFQALGLEYQKEKDHHIQWQTKWNETLQQLLKGLTTHSWEKQKVPTRLRGSLRPYQHDGFSWLMNMRKIGFGACLADDMGLGKTIQTISYMLAVKELDQPRQKHKPFLLICPTSLIGNWSKEIAQFAPSLSVYVHHGQSRHAAEHIVDTVKKVDVIVTSYSLAVRDEEIWKSYQWQGLILDEAQHVKNIETKQRRSIKEIEATHRIALTGTPIENRLRELWSIIDLLNDQFLGTYQQFYQTYIKDIEGNEQNPEKLAELKKLISPFLLRRTKQEQLIQLQLPKKKEVVHSVGLTVEQATLYQAVINNLFSKIGNVSDMERRALILSSLTKLKQICNHPVHYLKDNGSLGNRSEKWEKLLELTEVIIKSKKKALIFTQYKEMGMLMQKGLQQVFQKEIPFLHGSLHRQKREELIEQFQANDTPLFILSLKAGGVGLNLTAATHVIHYDRWWNPAVENQATDRAYRIGQTADVTVHKLITIGTLEEKIHAMLERKQDLSNQILNANENKLSELSTQDLEQFLKLRISNFTS